KVIPCLCMCCCIGISPCALMTVELAAVFPGLVTLLLYRGRSNRQEIRMQKQKAVTDDQVEKAYSIIARIVRDYGDAYLPMFTRLHEEREARNAKSALKHIALQVAQSSDL